MLTIDLGDNGGRLSVRMFSELQAWVATEREAWQWLTREALRHPQAAHICHRQLGVVGRLEAELAMLQRQPRGIRRRQALYEFAQMLREFYLDGRALHSESPQAQLVFDLHDLDPWSALHALDYFLGQELTLADGDEAARHGREAAEHFEAALTELDEDEKELDLQRASFRRRLGYYRHRMRTGDLPGWLAPLLDKNK